MKSGKRASIRNILIGLYVLFSIIFFVCIYLDSLSQWEIISNQLKSFGAGKPINKEYVSINNALATIEMHGKIMNVPIVSATGKIILPLGAFPLHSNFDLIVIDNDQWTTKSYNVAGKWNHNMAYAESHDSKAHAFFEICADSVSIGEEVYLPRREKYLGYDGKSKIYLSVDPLHVTGYWDSNHFSVYPLSSKYVIGAPVLNGNGEMLGIIDYVIPENEKESFFIGLARKL